MNLSRIDSIDRNLNIVFFAQISNGSFNFFFRIATFLLKFLLFSVYQERDLSILILLNESGLIAKH